MPTSGQLLRKDIILVFNPLEPSLESEFLGQGCVSIFEPFPSREKSLGAEPRALGMLGKHYL